MSLADLNGQRVVVGGGTGAVGQGVVQALLNAGANVIVPVRSSEAGARLAPHPRLTLLPEFPASDEEVLRARRALERLGPIHGAVACLGPWRAGVDLTQTPLEDWEAVITANLTSHFLFARLAAPLIVPQGAYVMVNGAAARSPAPGAGPVSIMARAQTMIGEVLGLEHPHLRTHTVMLASVVATRTQPSPPARWVTACEVGEACALLLGEFGKISVGSTLTLTERG